MTDRRTIELLLTPLGPPVPVLRSVKLHAGAVRARRVLVGVRVQRQDLLEQTLGSLLGALEAPVDADDILAGAQRVPDYVHIGIDPGPGRMAFGLYLEHTSDLVRSRRRRETQLRSVETHHACKWAPGDASVSVDTYRLATAEDAANVIRSGLRSGWPELGRLATRLIQARADAPGPAHHAGVLVVSGAEGRRTSIDVSVAPLVTADELGLLVTEASTATGTEGMSSRVTDFLSAQRPTRVGIGIARDDSPFLTIYRPSD